MYASASTRLCPRCSTVCPASAVSCVRCSFPFSRAGVRGAVGKRILIIFGALFLGGLIDAAILGSILHHGLISTDGYNQAIALAKSSAQAQDSLGDDIRVKLPAIGLSYSGRGSQFIEFSVRLIGSRGSGHLYAVGNKINGAWEFSRLSFVADHAGRTVDLAPVARLSLPPVARKKIYLIPVGWDSGASLDWAPAYYKAKLDIDVEVLPATSLPDELLDPRRQQVDSERFLEYLSRTHPEIVEDPASILIGVTSRDIFIRSFGWSMRRIFV